MTYVFDIWAGLDGNHVTVLDSEVVANNSVDPGASIVELLISENDKNGIAPLLAADEDGVTTEELEVLHGGLGQGNDGVVIVSGIGNPGCANRLAVLNAGRTLRRHEHQLVGLLLLLEDGRRDVIFLDQSRSASRVSELVGQAPRTSFTSAPEASLRMIVSKMLDRRRESVGWERVRQVDLLLVVVLRTVGHLDDRSPPVRMARLERGFDS